MKRKIILLPLNSYAVEKEMYKNVHGIEITETEYSNLLTMGFTEYQIYTIPEDIYLENKDLKGEVILNTIKQYGDIYGI